MALNPKSGEIRPDFFQKENPVGIIGKNVPLLDPAGINVMYRSGKVDSRSPWHGSGGFKNRAGFYGKWRPVIINSFCSWGKSTHKEAGADEAYPSISGVL
jgi:hypothetical protein